MASAMRVPAGLRSSHARAMCGARVSRQRVVQCFAGVRKTIPIFPLNVVALPAATVPLMIFEARSAPMANRTHVYMMHGACIHKGCTMQLTWSTYMEHAG